MKINKRFWKLRLAVIIAIFALIIAENTMQLNQQIVGLVQGVIFPLIIAPLAIESYQDKKWWLFTFSTLLTVITMLTLAQSIYRFYMLSH
ncbi:hypothetical protein PO181_06975 [Leuconostoc suionicum]|uniref:hypothetical protein n=1 Tax=Leuconostoc suionicum TaxID=1511761 RepID=UPI00233EEB3E|nr:hypothetical protein [Leuconostoc suionicum]MDC2816724.1 hypothetical protein [Leuconostoc suionicum]